MISQGGVLRKFFMLITLKKRGLTGVGEKPEGRGSTLLIVRSMLSQDNEISMGTLPPSLFTRLIG